MTSGEIDRRTAVRSAQLYGEVEIDARTRALTVTLRDVEGRGLDSCTLQAQRG